MNIKKYKQLIIGIIIGSTLTLGVAFANDIQTFVAEKADFPVVINGQAKEFDLPIVTIDDRTYMPLKAIGDTLGVNVEWNDSLKQVEIGDDKVNTDNITKTAQAKYEPTDERVAFLKPIQVGGGWCVEPAQIIVANDADKLNIRISWDKEKQCLYVTDESKNRIFDLDMSQCILESDKYHIPIDYYIDNIYPLTK